MANFEMLTDALRKEARNILESSGEVVTVKAGVGSLALTYKQKEMTVREYPRHNFVQWRLPTGRGGYLRVNSPAEAAIDLLQTLYRC